MHANDWVYAIRALRRAPRFTFAVTATLALGIGAATAIFSFANIVYLRPLPYPDANRLISIQETGPKGPTLASPASYDMWRKQPELFSAVGAWGWDSVTFSGGAWPERVQVQRIGGEYLQSLGVRPVWGRLFVPEEERAGAECAVLVSTRLWKWLGGADGAPRTWIAADGAGCRVLGVLPDGFLPPVSVSERVDAWMPLRQDAAPAAQTRRSLLVMARLAPGISREHVQHALQIQAGQLAESLPEMRGRGVAVRSLKEQVAGRPDRGLLILGAAVGCLLLIACINAATLLTARASGQRRELAIRAALGADRGRLIAHLLAQSLLLAMLGGAGGLAAAYWSLDGLVALAHHALPRLNEARIDWRVFAFTGTLSLATGILFGLAPAAALSRASLRETMHSARGRHLLRHAQIACEIAIAFVLVVGAGLLLRSLHAIQAVDLGFQTEKVLASSFALPPSHYSGPERYVQFLDEVLERVRALPGVIAATSTLGVPMRGSAGTDFEILGRPERQYAELRPGDSAYLATFGMTLERGRAFTARDRDGALPVALINQALARRFFPGEDPISKQIRTVGKDGGRPWMTIVGIVRDTHHTGPVNDAMPEMHVPYAQFRSTDIRAKALIVRTASDPARLLPAIQLAVASVDKDQPLVSVGTLEAGLAEFIAPQRFDTALMTIFGAMGLALATLGVFGAMSYRVARQTREIGVRMALGAERGRVLQGVLWEALRTAAAGLALGVGGAWMLTRYLRSLLFGIQPGDPWTLAGMAVLIVVTTAAAAYLPARRASRLDPMAAMREE